GAAASPRWTVPVRRPASCGSTATRTSGWPRRAGVRASGRRAGGWPSGSRSGYSEARAGRGTALPRRGRPVLPGGEAMADTVTARIAAYRAAHLNQAGESPEKCEIVQGLETHLSKPKALRFLLDLIGDPDEYDLARVEALKILQLWQPATEQV